MYAAKKKKLRNLQIFEISVKQEFTSRDKEAERGRRKTVKPSKPGDSDEIIKMFHYIFLFS